MRRVGVYLLSLQNQALTRYRTCRHLGCWVDLPSFCPPIFWITGSIGFLICRSLASASSIGSASNAITAFCEDVRCLRFRFRDTTKNQCITDLHNTGQGIHTIQLVNLYTIVNKIGSIPCKPLIDTHLQNY